MTDYEKAIEKMIELFSKDYQFALATCYNNIPSVRFVDAYFDGEAFYIVTYGLSQKVRDVAGNSNVALCGRKAYNFSGIADNIGHPLLPQNAQIRETLIKVFEPWYFEANNEDDSNMCYVKIKPTSGFFHKDGAGYKVNFTEKTVESFPFSGDIGLVEE